MRGEKLPRRRCGALASQIKYADRLATSPNKMELLQMCKGFMSLQMSIPSRLRKRVETGGKEFKNLRSQYSRVIDEASDKYRSFSEYLTKGVETGGAGLKNSKT